MICERCRIEHDGTYGSGRFCSKKCARGFATSKRRKEINAKVSKTLKGKKYFNRKKREPRNLESRNKQRESILKFYRVKRNQTPFEELSEENRRKVLLDECNHKCMVCGQGEEWRGKKITLHLHHKDRNKKNTRKENQEILCPNCHAITDSYGYKNISTEKRELRRLKLKMSR